MKKKFKHAVIPAAAPFDRLILQLLSTTRFLRTYCRSPNSTFIRTCGLSNQTLEVLDARHPPGKGLYLILVPFKEILYRNQPQPLPIRQKGHSIWEKSFQKNPIYADLTALFFVFTGTPQVSILAVSKRLTFGPLTLANILAKVIEFFIRHLRPLNYPLIAEARRLTTLFKRNSPLFQLFLMSSFLLSEGVS